MSAISRRRPGLGATPWIGLFFFLALFGALALPSLATLLDGDARFVNPLLWLLDGVTWSAALTTAALTIGAPLLLLLVLVVAVAAVRAARRVDTDAAAPLMAHGRALKRLRPRKVAARHRQMGLRPRDYPGVQLGYAVAGGTPLHGTYEDSYTLIAGPRRQKSRTVVIPNILLAPGSCIVTSVKPDVIDATADYRAIKGRVWVFDPQGLAAAHQAHRAWWNPLASIHTLEDAAQLASVFYAATYGADTGGKDQFWRENGTIVLRSYLFAAAVSGRPLPVVAEWLNRETDDEPAQLLRDAHPAVAAAIESQQGTAKDTRSGVYAHARGAVAFLSSAQMREWVVRRADRPEFVPEKFADAPSDTLYLFSEEDGAAGPLIAALTKAVTSAAEKAAKESPTGRRAVPMLVLLDEAGNICRLPDLPSKYSHWGGRGIVPVAIFQSQEQGEEVWGQGGFAQLWNASTVRVFGGGNASNRFLSDLSTLIGDYEFEESSRSTQNGKVSVTTSSRREPIFGIDDLPALDDRRMIVFAAGVRPVLARMVGYDKDRRLRARMRRITRAQRRASHHEEIAEPITEPIIVQETEPSRG